MSESQNPPPVDHRATWEAMKTSNPVAAAAYYDRHRAAIKGSDPSGAPPAAAAAPPAPVSAQLTEIRKQNPIAAAAFYERNAPAIAAERAAGAPR